MSYLVLARKYRPATFADVVGQEHVTRTLANAFAAGRVHHAFLFCGPRGCGKTTLARIVGKALNCTERQNTTEPCGACSACVSIANGSAVDYQEMDGASNRGIDAIRELTEAVRYQPAMLKQKVYVIDEVHMLTTEAFNALLKTLEEPPPHVTFVLATTEPHKLPNTILSRCQRYDFKLVTAARLAQHLSKIFAAEQLPVAAAALSLIVRESGGSVRDALSLSDQIISYVGNAEITEAHVAEVLGVADRSLTRTLVHALASGDAGSALAAVESAIERGVDEVQLARAVVRYLRDLSVLQAAPGRPQLVDAADEELAELTAEAGQLARSRVAQMFERMLRCCDDLGKTLQPRLVLDCALIDVATIEPLLPLGELIERLGELEAKIARGGGRASAAGGGGRSGARGPSPSPAAPTPAPPTQRAVDPGKPRDPTPAPAPVIDPPPKPAPQPEPGPPPIPTGDPKPEPAAIPQALTATLAPSGPIPVAPSVASGSGPSVTAPAVPSSPAETLAAWDKVLGALHERRKLSLLGMYEPARVLRWTATELELGFPVAMHATGEMAADPEKLEQLRAVLHDLGHAVKVAVRMLDAAESASGERRSILETTHENANAERSKREAEARGHRVIKQVLQTFGAQIKEIKTDV